MIAKLGWSRLNLGLEARKYTGFSVAGSYPVSVFPAEALLLAD
jgi:hypothetical protein